MKINDILNSCHINKNSFGRAIKVSSPSMANKLGTNHWDRFTQDQKIRITQEIQAMRDKLNDFLNQPEF